MFIAKKFPDSARGGLIRLKKVLILAACLLCLAQGTHRVMAADTTWYPGSVAIGLDARSLGMGGACLAVIDPWVSPANPAALVFLTNQGVFAGRYLDPTIDPQSGRGGQEDLYVFYVHPNEENGAYSVVAFQNTFTNKIMNDFTIFATRFTALQYGYGYALTDQISLGFNLRQVQTLDRADIGDLFNQFFTVDLGAVFRPNKALTASILLMDALSPSVRYDIDVDNSGVVDDDEHYYFPVQSRLLFGGSFRLGNFLAIAADVDYNLTVYADLWNMTRVGVELRPLPFLAVRGGYYHGQPTMGFGFILGKPDGVQVNLDFGQYWPENGDYLSVTQCMQMVAHF